MSMPPPWCRLGGRFRIAETVPGLEEHESEVFTRFLIRSYFKASATMPASSLSTGFSAAVWGYFRWAR